MVKTEVETSLQETIFALCKLFYKDILAMGDWIFEETRITSLKKVKRFFGIISHRCVLCRSGITYYRPRCKMVVDKKPVGEERPLPLPSSGAGSITLDFPYSYISVDPRGTPIFGICKSGHNLIRLIITASHVEDCYVEEVYYRFNPVNKGFTKIEGT